MNLNEGGSLYIFQQYLKWDSCRQLLTLTERECYISVREGELSAFTTGITKLSNTSYIVILCAPTPSSIFIISKHLSTNYNCANIQHFQYLWSELLLFGGTPIKAEHKLSVTWNRTIVDQEASWQKTKAQQKGDTATHSNRQPRSKMEPRNERPTCWSLTHTAHVHAMTFSIIF